MSKFEGAKVHLISNDNGRRFVNEVSEALTRPGREIIDIQYQPIVTPTSCVIDRCLIIYKENKNE